MIAVVASVIAVPGVLLGDDGYPRQPGIDVLEYAFNLRLSDESDEIHGFAKIRILFARDGVTSLNLDLVSKSKVSATGMAVSGVSWRRGKLQYEHADDRLRITLPMSPRVGETLRVTIEYAGVPADGLIIATNVHGDRTFFGDNWPNRARHWIPTVDHPYDKAAVDWTIIAPDHYQVVANGLLVEETDLEKRLRLSRWRERTPIATKVMVIGVARFAVQSLRPLDGTPIQTWVYAQDRDASSDNFVQARDILDYFEKRIGPYPYAKLANVQSKTKFGGMENAGNIFYNENSVRGTRSIEGLIAHEVAHQWFGNSVTEADWHHVWLSEGFATYFTQLYMEHHYGRDRLQQGMRSAHGAVIGFHRRKPDATIVDERIDDLMQLLNPNSYQKGGWVLHMLRGVVGDEDFWEGVRNYYARHRDANALTVDFQRVMEHAAGVDLDWFFKQWLYQPGYPVYAWSWTYDGEAGRLRVKIDQVQAEEPFQMPLELGIALGEDETRIERVLVGARHSEFGIELEGEPSSVELDPNGWVLMEAEIREST